MLCRVEDQHLHGTSSSAGGCTGEILGHGGHPPPPLPEGIFSKMVVMFCIPFGNILQGIDQEGHWRRPKSQVGFAGFVYSLLLLLAHSVPTTSNKCRRRSLTCINTRAR